MPLLKVITINELIFFKALDTQTFLFELVIGSPEMGITWYLGICELGQRLLNFIYFSRNNVPLMKDDNHCVQVGYSAHAQCFLCCLS
jgi:hypothetical protein